MRNFVGDTIDAFQQTGMRLYNHAVMMLPLNTLPMRASTVFKAAAKLGMCHQHVLVFYKVRRSCMPPPRLPRLRTYHLARHTLCPARAVLLANGDMPRVL